MALSGIKHIDVGTELTKTEWESEASHAIVAGTAFPTDPAPVEQQLFYRTDLHVLYIYNGSAWVSTDVTTHSALTTGVHGATGTVLHTSSTGLITYDLTDKFFLPYQVARKLYRYANEVFNTYDMISVSVTGTGVNQQAYMN